jgi:hypothetical protein
MAHVRESDRESIKEAVGKVARCLNDALAAL